MLTRMGSCIVVSNTSLAPKVVAILHVKYSSSSPATSITIPIDFGGGGGGLASVADNTHR